MHKNAEKERSRQYLMLLNAFEVSGEGPSTNSEARYYAIAEAIAFPCDDRWDLHDLTGLEHAIYSAMQDCSSPVMIDLEKLQSVCFNDDLARLALGMAGFWYDSDTNMYIDGHNFPRQELDVRTIKVYD